MSYYSVEQAGECLKQLKKRTGSETVIKEKNSLCQTDGQRQCEKKAMILQGIVVFFYSSNFFEFLISFVLFYFNPPFITVSRQHIFRCRSPTVF